MTYFGFFYFQRCVAIPRQMFQKLKSMFKQKWEFKKTSKRQTQPSTRIAKNFSSFLESRPLPFPGLSQKKLSKKKTDVEKKMKWKIKVGGRLFSGTKISFFILLLGTIFCSSEKSWPSSVL